MVEIIVAMSIMFMGALFVFKMFHLALYMSGSVGDEAIASILAQRKMEQIRGWAWQKTGMGGAFNFFAGDWNVFHDKVETDPTYPKFTILSKVASHQIEMPFTGFPGNSSILLKSSKVVKVQVSWKVASMEKNVSLVTLVGEPRADSARVVVAPGGSIVLGPHERMTFTARCEDSDGNEIPNVPFHWHVNPMTGNGVVTWSKRNPSTATFTNHVQRLDGTIVVTEGNCRVSAVARVAGEEVPGYSVVMRLNR